MATTHPITRETTAGCVIDACRRQDAAREYAAKEEREALTAEWAKDADLAIDALCCRGETRVAMTA